MSILKNILFKGSFFKNVTKLLSANLILQIIAFALSPIISRLYTASDFGLLAVFMSIAGFFIIIATGRFELALILPKKDEEANALLKLSFFLNLFVTFLSLIFMLFYKSSLASYYNIIIPSNWFYLIPLVVFFASSFYIFINYSNRLKKYSQQANAQLVLGLSNPLTTIALATENGFSFGMIKAVFISNFITSIYLLKKLWKHNIFQTKIKTSKVFRDYIEFPLYNLPHALLNFFSNSLPIFILTPAFGDISIGLFSMALGKVFKPINMFGNSIYQVLSKKIVDDIQNKKPVTSQVVKLLKTMLLIGIIPFVILFFIAPQLFAFVWGEEWRMSGVYLKYLLPWLFLVYLTSSVSFLPNVLKQQKGALVIEFFHLVFRFVVLYIGVRKNNILLALGLYSTVGVVMLSTTLIWYIFILKNRDVKNVNNI